MKFSYIYFCSKFLLYVDGRWWFIPDPLKIITKLGRRDLANKEHATEYRTSLKDLLKPLYDPRVYTELSRAMNERYSSSWGDLTPIFRALVSLVEDDEEWKSLFYSEPSDRLCYDPSRRKLE